MRFLGFQGGKTGRGSWGRGRDKGPELALLIALGCFLTAVPVPSGQHSF